MAGEAVELLYGTSGIAASGGMSNFAKLDYWDALGNGVSHRFDKSWQDFALSGGWIGYFYRQHFGGNKNSPSGSPGIIVPAIALDPAIAKKMYDELTNLYKKTLNNPGVVYVLRAKSDGYYNVYAAGSTIPTGQVYLKAGEIWKYGETTSMQRYDPSYLTRENVRFAPIAAGNLLQIKAREKFLFMDIFSRMVDCLLGIKFLDSYDCIFHRRVFY